MPGQGNGQLDCAISQVITASFNESGKPACLHMGLPTHVYACQLSILRLTALDAQMVRDQCGVATK